VDTIGFGVAGDYIYFRNTVTTVYMRIKLDGTGKEIFNGVEWVSMEE